MSLSDAAFTKAMSTLEKFYASTIVLDGGILEGIYYEGLKKLSDQQMLTAIMECIKNNSKQYGFFPSVAQLLDYSGYDLRPPGEKGIANYKAPALASVEINRDNLTDEQAQARLAALRLETNRRVSEAQGNARKRRNGFYHVGRVLDPVEAKNEELTRMRTYLKTGISELVNRAIAWVNNPANECEFIYDDAGKIAGIQELEF